MVDGLAEKVPVGEPPACFPMELDYPVGILTLEAVLKEFGEQVVITEPLALVVEPSQEQVP
ncbi:hypothetical protein Rhow_001304 [Rhodococcus wratislaviensis]|uniref:Uncharacterized protein n=1 Tax=Rhodococcus wratislaviensis TaxID=44752 RepID=A0A402CNK0_RHOWR|nr:hypothetical protein Rhow_001304 [Rhodococcus wratislaviensis]